MPRCPKLTRALAALERVAPTRLSASWDNTGVLVDSTASLAASASYRLLFTNDLTPKVLEEAVETKANCIVTYHPTPFVGMKKFSLDNHAASVVLTCASKGIAVFSPHTSLDVIPGGINDWLVEGIVTSINKKRAGEALEFTNGPVKPSANPVDAAAGIGDGRVARLRTPVSLAEVVAAVKEHLSLPTVAVALPSTHLASVAAGTASVAAAAASLECDSFAVCAGSGSSVLGGCKASILITGELDHHAVLAANAAGSAVVLTNHSNCERGYLPVYVAKFQEALKALEAEDSGSSSSSSSSIVIPASSYECVVSKVDADPLVVL